MVDRLDLKVKGKLCTCGHHRKHHRTTTSGPHQGGCGKCECPRWEIDVATPQDLARRDDGAELVIIFEWKLAEEAFQKRRRREREKQERDARRKPFSLREEEDPAPADTGARVSEEGLLRRQLQLMQARRAKGGTRKEPPEQTGVADLS